MARIESSPTWDILSQERTEVDGQAAMLFDTVVNENGLDLDRRIYVVDLPAVGTLFVAATNQASKAPPELSDDDLQAALQELVGSLAL